MTHEDEDEEKEDIDWLLIRYSMSEYEAEDEDEEVIGWNWSYIYGKWSALKWIVIQWKINAFSLLKKLHFFSVFKRKLETQTRS